MNSLARALLGVALGSCLTLLIHPASRRFMSGLLPRPQETAVVSEVAGAAGNLREPHSLADAGLWLQLGCQRLDSTKPLTKEELKTLVRIARAVSVWKTDSSNEFENAFWPQMAAVFLDQLGDAKGARKEWAIAARRAAWRDYEASKLLLGAQRMDRVHGAMAWHLASMYYLRKDAVGRAVFRYAHKIVDPVGLDSREALGLRMDTLLNGRLIADGARSLEILRYGTKVSELAVVPAGTNPKQRKIQELRGKFYKALTEAGMLDEAQIAVDTYNENDSRSVLPQEFDPEANAKRLSGFSIVTATLPGAMIVGALIGGLAWLGGLLVSRWAGDHDAFPWPPTVAFGSALGVGLFSVTLLPLVGLVALLSSLFLLFSPKNERSKYPSELGPLFTWTIGALVVLFLLVTSIFCIELTAPARILMPSLVGEKPQHLGKPATLFGLAAVIAALLLLLAPMWALAKRIRTPFVLGLVLRTFGKILVTVSLVGVVIGGPLCVYADSRVRSELNELVGNEPLHYYIIFR